MDQGSQFYAQLVREADDLAVIEVGGELDIDACPPLGQCLDEAEARGAAQTVVDLTSVSFIDSAALGVLIGNGRRLESRDASLMIACRDNSVACVLKITGLDRIFAIHTLD
jgi:anti-sigma B factor antagonist